MREMITSAAVPNFPSHWVQSFHWESLSYSWEYGDYLFIQVNNFPGYIASSIHIDASFSWLNSELQRGTAAGKKIVLNMHDFRLRPTNYGRIRISSVVAIFYGHLQQLYVNGAARPRGSTGGECEPPLTNIFGDVIPVVVGGHSGNARTYPRTF